MPVVREYWCMNIIASYSVLKPFYSVQFFR